MLKCKELPWAPEMEGMSMCVGGFLALLTGRPPDMESGCRGSIAGEGWAEGRDVRRARDYLIGKGFQTFFKGSYSQNCRLYGPHGFCHNNSPLRHKNSNSV